jgi:hypothetical protein
MNVRYGFEGTGRDCSEMKGEMNKAGRHFNELRAADIYFPDV